MTTHYAETLPNAAGLREIYSALQNPADGAALMARYDQLVNLAIDDIKHIIPVNNLPLIRQAAHTYGTALMLKAIYADPAIAKDFFESRIEYDGNGEHPIPTQCATASGKRFVEVLENHLKEKVPPIAVFLKKHGRLAPGLALRVEDLTQALANNRDSFVSLLSDNQKTGRDLDAALRDLLAQTLHQGDKSVYKDRVYTPENIDGYLSARLNECREKIQQAVNVSCATNEGGRSTKVVADRLREAMESCVALLAPSSVQPGRS